MSDPAGRPVPRPPRPQGATVSRPSPGPVESAPTSTTSPSGEPMHFTIQSEQEEDGRWIAEVPELPGVLAYGANRDEALARAEVLALRVLAERLEHNEGGALPISIAVA